MRPQLSEYRHLPDQYSGYDVEIEEEESAKNEEPEEPAEDFGKGGK